MLDFIYIVHNLKKKNLSGEKDEIKKEENGREWVVGWIEKKKKKVSHLSVYQTLLFILMCLTTLFD